ENVGGSRRGRNYNRIYIHSSAVAIETHAPVNQSENRVITSKSDVLSRQKFCPPLTHNDVAGHNRLTAEFFHTEPFADAFAPVLNAALSFFMSHNGGCLRGRFTLIFSSRSFWSQRRLF